MDEKVMVTSMVSSQVSLVSPELRLRKTWPKKGASLPIDKAILREAIYEPGIEYMFKNGVLYIEDMDFKIELGLEPEGAKTPTEIIPMDDKYMNRVLKLMPIAEMKNTIKSMNEDQVQELITYASAMRDIQFDKLDAIKQVTGIDIFKVIEINRQKGE